MRALTTASTAIVIGSLGAFGATISLTAVARADRQTVQQCLDASEQATTLRHAQSLVASRQKYIECAAPTCPSDVQIECARQADAVTKDLPSIIFEVRDAEGHVLTAVTVKVDGATWFTKLDGTAQAIDPGSHRFEFSAAGQPSATRTLTLQKGEVSRHETVTLEAARPAAPEVSVDASADRSWQMPAAYGALALGVVGVGLGTYFGIHAASKWSSAQSECTTTASCSDRATAASDRSSATSAATVSTVSFVAGGAFLAGGLVLFFTAPAPSPSSGSGLRWAPLVGPTNAGLSVSGGFE